MAQDTKDPANITLPNVRLSFPHLFTAHAMEEGQEAKFSATFLLDNTIHGALLDHIDAVIERLALDQFKKKIGFKRCLKDGNEKSELEGYGDGISFLTASNKVRPGVVDRRLNPVTEADGIIYAGCYVNAIIRLWVQDNKWGKRVNAQLQCVQFVKDGESFGVSTVDPTKAFSALDEANEEAQRASQPRSWSTGGRSTSRPAATNLDDF